MNTEKQITISDITGKFNKDFDTFGKMDPFLIFEIGKNSAQTETHEQGGKEPIWKKQIVLNYFDEPIISVKAYDEDATENQFIGSCTIQIKSLRFPGGALEANFHTDSGELIGSLTAKYVIKNLPTVPLLIIKNLKCDLVKQHSFLLKTKPYICFSAEENTVRSKQKDDPQGIQFSWNQNLRLRIKQNSTVFIQLLDKNQKDNVIFSHEASARQFRLQSGSKKYNVFNPNYTFLGTVQFDFETLNLVSKEESIKNLEKQKKNQSELTSILVNNAKINLAQDYKEIYLDLIVGSNKITTELSKATQKSANFEIKKLIYAEPKQNEIIVLLWQKNTITDKLIGVAKVPLEATSSGDKKITFINQDQKAEVATGFLSIITKTVLCAVLNIQAISVSFVEGGDILGQSQPYVVARVGNWQGRTETGDQNRITFKKGIELKFNDEQVLQLQVWDEDLTSDEVIYSQKINMSQLKAAKGQMSVALHLKENDKLLKKGKLSFKYQFKGNYSGNQISRKISQQKSTELKPQSKVQQPKSSELNKNNSPTKQILPQISPKKSIKQEQKNKTQSNNLRTQQKNKTVTSQQKNHLTQRSQLPKKDIEQSLIHNKNQSTSRLQDNTQKQKHTTLRSQKKNFVSKSKQSINLPSIRPTHINYGDNIFEKQSAATLQKSILVYSMPKAPRFVNEPKYTGQPSYCLDSCFKSNSTKGVGFGYGRKKQFPDWMERNMKQNPPPGAYFDSNNDIRSKGPTFGLSHKHYQKVLIPKQKRESIHHVQKLQPIRQAHK